MPSFGGTHMLIEGKEYMFPLCSFSDQYGEWKIGSHLVVDGWMDESMDEWMDERIDEWMDELNG